jgi:hypothetical protein
MLPHYVSTTSASFQNPSSAMLTTLSAGRANPVQPHRPMQSASSCAGPFTTAKQNGRPYSTVREPNTNASASELSLLAARVAFQPPRAPSSVIAEPTKKQPRIDSDSGFDE